MIAVQPAGARILSGGELTLLAWLAQEQRVMSQGRAMPADPLLIVVVTCCTGMLDAMALHLGLHRLYDTRLR